MEREWNGVCVVSGWVQQQRRSSATKQTKKNVTAESACSLFCLPRAPPPPPTPRCSSLSIHSSLSTRCTPPPVVTHARLDALLLFLQCEPPRRAVWPRGRRRRQLSQAWQVSGCEMCGSWESGEECRDWEEDGQNRGRPPPTLTRRSTRTTRRPAINLFSPAPLLSLSNPQTMQPALPSATHTPCAASPHARALLPAAARTRPTC